MKKLAVFVASAALTALAVAGCSTQANQTPTAGQTSAAGQTPSKKAVTLGLSIAQGDKYFSGIQSGLEAAAAVDSSKVITVNSNVDSGIEATNIQNLIQRGVDAVILQPATSVDGALATMKSVKAAGIPLICFGNCTGDATSKDVVDGFVQSDNTALGTGTGKVAAQYIKDHLGGKATLAILNCDSAEVCKLRKSGFKDALQAAGVTVDYAADQEAYLPDKATPVATNMLIANPKINVIWAANEGGTIGAVTAAMNADHPVVVFGTDITDQLAKYLLDDKNPLQATTGQDPQGTAASAYKMALNAINGGVNDPFEVLIPGNTFTRTDVDKINKYLGK